ncbi:MAG: ATP-binding protein [Planctomycetes bacterium]|nr:ATP-binding protein [Planctomycetota bacterium]
MADETLEHFVDIKLPENGSYECNPDGGLAPLSIVNLFIGANHSGKSRLLRALSVLAGLCKTRKFA